MLLKKILIVDDEVDILSNLSRFLKTSGIEVITTTRIEEAEYAIKNTSFDVVIADIRLTGVLGREGLELLPFIQEKSPGTKVIIMTGYGTPEIEKEAYDLGASFYFDKPIDLHRLRAAVEQLGIPPKTGSRPAP
jgi:DNA-binding NtrC family response regulator